jgi:hypothetical protein
MAIANEGYESWIDCNKDEKANYRSAWAVDSGMSWIEGDQLCIVCPDT